MDGTGGIILVVCDDQVNGAAYAEACGVDSAVTPGMQEAVLVLGERPVFGIVVDVQTSVRFPFPEKEALRRLANHFPTARVQLTPRDRRIHVVAQPNETTLALFAERAARTFPARRIRKHPRYEAFVNVNVAVDGADEPERTFCVDVSKGGAYLHSDREHQVGEALKVVVIDKVAGVTGVTAEVVVRRVATWGPPLRVPGIGVEVVSDRNPWSRVAEEGDRDQIRREEWRRVGLLK